VGNRNMTYIKSQDMLNMFFCFAKVLYISTFFAITITKTIRYAHV
jgi:hypothetical protein